LQLCIVAQPLVVVAGYIDRALLCAHSQQFLVPRCTSEIQIVR
jgi:hypothetical protein